MHLSHHCPLFRQASAAQRVLLLHRDLCLTHISMKEFMHEQFPLSIRDVVRDACVKGGSSLLYSVSCEEI